jgi:hypothetical protein
MVMLLPSLYSNTIMRVRERAAVLCVLPSSWGSWACAQATISELKVREGSEV